MGPADSWIEIGSGPSSSSLSSIADNEIITTGLRVQHDSNTRRRRHPRSTGQFRVGTGYQVTPAGGGNSSQEEYDESESESDRVMTSSNEGIGPSPLRNEIRFTSRGPYSSSDTMSEREDEDDDDENATAVNYPTSSRRQFEPRPNAFSHPSTQHAVRSQSGTAYTPRRPAPRSQTQRHSYPSHSPFNGRTPNAQAEHDEVLRASLSTLLSAAAAVRGLPKPASARTVPPNNSARIDHTTLRLVPESVALGEITEESSSRTVSTGAPSSSPRTASSSPLDKSKRKDSLPVSTSTRSSSKDRNTVKKVRRVGPLVEEISPTLLTWVLSASVLAIVGVVSFSTGYSMGKEAGHAEALGHLGPAGSCGQEATSGLSRAGMSLKRLRWTGGSGVRV
ncbi:hypothetical protein P280DRAFT_410066 [Massarina eburnea CBS 473.64]|uniref:REJ domain-containing protein n=1 Tax=Massarina eburnea CBS 473.64 TaxID=1395130 RepID=A0A6A6RLL7_9PLEO|nr:hypothetical protein P280DRAFT_410066 [Massarina eburnea CBS 473.64]